jgi:hypothetical protein
MTCGYIARVIEADCNEVADVHLQATVDRLDTLNDDFAEFVADFQIDLTGSGLAIVEASQPWRAASLEQRKPQAEGEGEVQDVVDEELCVGRPRLHVAHVYGMAPDLDIVESPTDDEVATVPRDGQWGESPVSSPVLRARTWSR